jgi:glycerophosphoryl diester phosphodiesterase
MTFNFSNIAILVFAGILTVSLAACGSNSELGSEQLKPHYYAHPVDQECCTVIAHAGGAIDGNSYSNSREAVELNYNYGTRLFELDFGLTSDGHWVAAHDWPNWKRRTEFAGEIPPDLSTFNDTTRKWRKSKKSVDFEYSAIDMRWLEAFLEQHPDAYIITDMKEIDKFTDFVDVILESPNRDQFVFQAYSIKHIEQIKERSENAKIILTLYRLGYAEATVAKMIEKKDDLIGITAPMDWALVEGIAERLVNTGLPIYLHGTPSNINSRSMHEDFAARGINGFYLD